MGRREKVAQTREGGDREFGAEATKKLNKESSQVSHGGASGAFLVSLRNIKNQLENVFVVRHNEKNEPASRPEHVVGTRFGTDQPSTSLHSSESIYLSIHPYILPS